MKFILILLIMLNLTGLDAKAEDIHFSVIGDKAVVTGFEGEPDILDIPSIYQDVPVAEIRDNAFYKCSSLKSVTLPDSIEKMGHHCFFGCEKLEDIRIPDSVSEIGMGCFEDCFALNDVSLPEKISVLPDSCFRGCTSLRSVAIPNNVREIEDFCFAGCSSLTSVSLSGELTSVGDLAFYGCPLLPAVYVPVSVENIGMQAFGFGENGVFPEFSITGSPGSSAEVYARENGFVFIDDPETKAVFAPQESENAPVELPEIFIFAGLFFLIMAMISAFRNSGK